MGGTKQLYSGREGRWLPGGWNKAAVLRERGEVAAWWVEQSSYTEGEEGGGYLVGGTKQLYSGRGGRWLPGGWNQAAVLRERGEVATWWVEESSCTEGEGGGGYLVGGTKQLYSGRGEVAAWWVEQSSCTQGEGKVATGGRNKAAGGYLVGGIILIGPEDPR